ncbi:MAG: hypothetical protein AB1589_01895 [Cyanobacteriota bacterium]
MRGDPLGDIYVQKRTFSALTLDTPSLDDPIDIRQTGLPGTSVPYTSTIPG